MKIKIPEVFAVIFLVIALIDAARRNSGSKRQSGNSYRMRSGTSKTKDTSDSQLRTAILQETVFGASSWKSRSNYKNKGELPQICYNDKYDMNDLDSVSTEGRFDKYDMNDLDYASYEGRFDKYDMNDLDYASYEGRFDKYDMNDLDYASYEGRFDKYDMNDLDYASYEGRFDKYDMNDLDYISYEGRFVCPTDITMGDGESMCCGQEGQQYCCNFWGKIKSYGIGPIAGVVIGIIAFVAFVFVLTFCIIKNRTALRCLSKLNDAVQEENGPQWNCNEPQ